MSAIYGKQPDFTRPVLFLDFDDVINIFDERRDDLECGLRFEQIIVPRGTENPHGNPISEDRRLTFVFDEEIVARLRPLNAVWLTSWKGLTQKYQNPVLDTDFGYVEWSYRGLSDSGMYGKAAAIGEVVEKYGIKAFAVADNCFEGVENLIDHHAGGAKHIVVAPPSYIGCGLTSDDLDRLEEFLAG